MKSCHIKCRTHLEIHAARLQFELQQQTHLIGLTVIVRLLKRMLALVTDYVTYLLSNIVSHNGDLRRRPCMAINAWSAIYSRQFFLG